MKRPKRLQIAPSRKWGWGMRAAIFSGVLSFLWLVLDPFFAFVSQNNPIAVLGIWGYIILIVAAVVITIIAEQLTIQRIPNEVSKVEFTVIMTETGQRYPVSAPHDMRIADFLKRLLKQTMLHAEKDSMLSHLDIFQTTLLVERGGSYTAVETQQTLREAGIHDGDVCKIRTTIRPEHASRELET